MGVQDYDTTAANNTAISGIAISGSSSIKNGDNALRQLMADTATGIRNSSYMAAGYITKATGYTVVAADRGKIIDCTAALTLSLTAAATLGQGFMLIAKANGGAVTVDPSGTETINGDSASLVIPDGAFAVIACTGTAWNALVAGNVTKTGTETLTNKTLTSPTINTPTIASPVVTGADPWAFQPIGMPIPLLDNIAGVTAPPKDKAYRYIEMTAGKTGAGEYNEAILTSESVSGSAPLVVATAVISLTGSPINGRTVNLINTERRFLRAGSAGTIENDQLQEHTHGIGFVDSSFGSGSFPRERVRNNSEFQSTPTGTTGRFGTETRPKNIGVTYYMRIK